MPAWREGIHLECIIDRQPLIVLQPSIQKLITSLAQDCVLHLNEEATHTDGYTLDTSRVDQALFDLESEFSTFFVDRKFLTKATEKSAVRNIKRNVVYNDTVWTTSSKPDQLTKSWSHQGLLSPWSCIEAYNSCKSRGTESSHEATNISI